MENKIQIEKAIWHGVYTRKKTYDEIAQEVCDLLWEKSSQSNKEQNLRLMKNGKILNICPEKVQGIYRITNFDANQLFGIEK